MKYDFNYVSPKLKALLEPASMKPHYFQGDLSFKEYTDSFIIPFISWDQLVGSGQDNHYNILDSSVTDSPVKESLDVQDAVTEHKTVIYLGFLPGVFGHGFTDNYRTLWFLDTKACKDYLESGAEFIYTSNFNKPLSDTYARLLQMAGFDIRKARLIDRLTKFDKIILPDSTFIDSDYGRLYCDGFCTILDRVRDHISKIPTDPAYDKIYFTRTKFQYRKESGEEKIEDYFRQAGFTIISPEQYPLDTQLQMIRSCSCFASTEGSVAHISLFCKPGTKVIIVNKANYMNEYQIAINEIADLDVTYIQAHHSSVADHDHPWWGPFFLYPTKYLRRFFGYTSAGLPYWLSKDYWSYYFGNNPKTRLLKKLYRYIKHPHLTE